MVEKYIIKVRDGLKTMQVTVKDPISFHTMHNARFQRFKSAYSSMLLLQTQYEQSKLICGLQMDFFKIWVNATAR